VTIATSVLDGVVALMYLAIAGWLVYALIKPRPAPTALLAMRPMDQRWLFLVMILACVAAVMSFSLGSMAGVSATCIRYTLTHR